MKQQQLPAFFKRSINDHDYHAQVQDISAEHKQSSDAAHVDVCLAACIEDTRFVGVRRSGRVSAGSADRARKRVAQLLQEQTEQEACYIDWQIIFYWDDSACTINFHKHGNGN